MILRGGKEKPFRINELSHKTWITITLCKDFGCGLYNPTLEKIIKVPDFIFYNNCLKHDLMTRRGGGLLDFLETNYYFFKFNYKDSLNFIKYLVNKKKDLPIVNKFFWYLIVFAIGVGLFIVATIFSLVATIGDLFVFSWGKYKDIDVIIKEAIERC